MTSPRAELAAYLGKHFEPHKLTGFDVHVVKEYQSFPSAVEFYKGSKEYLYHLTAFSMDIWKRPYLVLAREVRQPCRVLDYGAGIGADGLALFEYGYEPAFADYQTRCTEFLRWRIERRELETEIYDIEKDEIPRFPLLVSFDVVEHISPDEQWSFVQRLAELGEIVVINLHYPFPSIYDAVEGLHYPVDVDELEERIRSNYTVVSAKTFHGGRVRGIAFKTPDPENKE